MTESKGVAPPYYKSLEELKGRKDPQAMKAVAKEMETLFAHEMVKAMKKMSPGFTPKGLGGDVFMGMFDLELAKILSDRGLGLQNMFVRDLERKEKPAVKEGNTPAGKNFPAEKGEKEKVTGVPSPVTEKETIPQSPQPLRKSIPANRPSSADGTVSSGYGERKHPITGKRKFHDGVDIAAPAGTDIRPVMSGKVVFSGNRQGYGKTVVIDHGAGMTTTYAHNKRNFVKAGDTVDPQTVIAQVGSTGASTGPHLHLEVRNNGKSIDPARIIDEQKSKEYLASGDKRKNSIDWRIA